MAWGSLGDVDETAFMADSTVEAHGAAGSHLSKGKRPIHGSSHMDGVLSDYYHLHQPWDAVLGNHGGFDADLHHLNGHLDHVHLPQNEDARHFEPMQDVDLHANAEYDSLLSTMTLVGRSETTPQQNQMLYPDGDSSLVHDTESPTLSFRESFHMDIQHSGYSARPHPGRRKRRPADIRIPSDPSVVSPPNASPSFATPLTSSTVGSSNLPSPGIGFSKNGSQQTLATTPIHETTLNSVLMSPSVSQMPTTATQLIYSSQDADVSERPSIVQLQHPVQGNAALDVHEVFECPTCAKHFLKRAPFKHHLKSHRRNHQCNYEHCDKSFSSPKDLRRHQVTHTDIPTCFCHVTGCKYARRGFARKDNLKRHLNNVHARGFDEAPDDDHVDIS